MFEHSLGNYGIFHVNHTNFQKFWGQECLFKDSVPFKTNYGNMKETDKIKISQGSATEIVAGTKWKGHRKT